jgi:hypothetical protein
VRVEEKIVCKVVGAIEFSNLAHDICRVKIRKKWWVYLHRLGLQSAQRHTQISKIGDIFEKISTESAIFSIVPCIPD